MIKFTATNEQGKPIYGFGLSYANLRLLKKGKPILVDLAQMGSEGQVLIFAGETEQEMYDQIKHRIGTHTKISKQDDSFEQSEKYNEEI